MLRNRVAFSCFERVPESLHNVVSIALRPPDVHHFSKITTKRIRNLAESPECRRVHLRNPEIGIHKVDSERRLVEQCFKLCRSLPHALFSLLAQPSELEVSSDPRQEFAGAEWLGQVIVRTVSNALDPGFFAFQAS
jgi:hypothetical protein